MYSGQIVESGATDAIFAQPSRPLQPGPAAVDPRVANQGRRALHH